MFSMMGILAALAMWCWLSYIVEIEYSAIEALEQKILMENPFEQNARYIAALIVGGPVRFIIEVHSDRSKSK